MCGVAKLRRKKIPNLFLGICIVITSALLVNAVILIKELDSVFDGAYGEMEGAQICCRWGKGAVSPEAVRQYLDGLQEGFEYQMTEHTKTVYYVEKDGKKLSNGILLELPEILDGEMLSPKVLDESEAAMPAKDEIWVAAKMANILHLEVGDDVSLQMADQPVSAKVAKIVADPVFGGSNTNVYRMWCGYGRLSDFPMADNSGVSYLEIRFREYSRQTEQQFIRDAEEYFKMPFGDTFYTYDIIKSGYTSTYQMVGTLLCLVSVVLVVTVMILTLFLIKSDIDEDIRNIGIYKSLGMSGMQVVSVYLVSYGLIGMAGAALGSTLGGWLNNKIMVKILGDIGIYTVSLGGMGGYLFGAGFAIWSAVMMICLLSVFKVRRLHVSHAIRENAWQRSSSSCGGGKRERNPAVSFELYYAIRGMKKKKAGYVYIAGVSLVLGCLTTVCLGCLNAVSNIDRNPEAWGMIQTDIYITSQENVPVSTVIDELEQDARVDYAYGMNKVHSEYKPGGEGRYQSIVTEIYELPWNEKTKDQFLYGRRPERDGEIGVGLALADKYGLEIGGKMELYVNGEKREYGITGIFQTLSNYGNVIRMVTDHLDQWMEKEGGYGDYMLVLSNSAGKWEYAEELTQKYGDKFTFIASKSNGENFTGALVPALGTILTVLFGIVTLITINLTLLLVRREQKLIGLLKAVGMTSWQVVKIYLWRNCLSAIVGNSLGLVAGTFIIPGLLTPYAKLLGLTEFPFANSMTGVLVAGALLPACMFLGTCAVIKAIGTVSVKQLVNE